MVTDKATLKAWNTGALESVDPVTLDRVIAAAQRWVEDYCSRKFETASYTEIFSGDRADGPNREVLRLNRARWPVSAVSSVTESGIALTIATGYSTTAHVIVEGQGEEAPARLIRTAASPPTLATPRGVPGWAPGVQNITVGYTAGYAANALPASMVQTVLEVAYVMLRTGRTVNVASQGKGGHTVALLRDLSPATRTALEQLRSW